MPVDVTYEELYRRPGQVGYRIRATLKPDAAPGHLKQELTLKTNDPTSPTVPVLVEAAIFSGAQLVEQGSFLVGREARKEIRPRLFNGTLLLCDALRHGS